jgi:hypothetical protein
MNSSTKKEARLFNLMKNLREKIGRSGRSGRSGSGRRTY